MNLTQRTNVTFTAPGLPTIGDYGNLYFDNIVGLYKMAASGTKYTDESGLSHDIVNSGTTVAGGMPSWSGGVLTVPNGNAIEAGKYNRLALSPYSATLNKTFVLLVKNVGSNTYLLHGTPVSIFMNGNTLQLIYNNGPTRQINMQATDQSVWNLIVFTMDALGVYISLNGAAFQTHLFASAGGPPTAASATAFLGAGSTAQGMSGLLAFVAQYDRTMTQLEATSMYRGVKAWAKNTKSILV